MAARRLCQLAVRSHSIADRFRTAASFLKPHNHSAVLSIPSCLYHRPSHVMVDTVTVHDHKSASDILKHLTPEDAHILRCLKVEYQVLSSLDQDVPKSMPDTRWLELLEDHPTEESRRAVYQYWVQRDQAEKNERLKQKFQAKTRHSAETSFVLYPSQNTIEQHYTNNLAHAMSFGVPLVFDFGFEGEMSDSDLSRLSNEFEACYRLNQAAKEPFHFHLSGVVNGSRTQRALRETMPDCDKVPFTVTEESFLERFPREKIVYLTADSPKVLKKYSRNNIYVIGCLSKILGEGPLTYVKARRENIDNARLPLSKYLRWNPSFKDLSIYQVLRIMLELKASNKWNKALQDIHPKLHRDRLKDS